MSDVNNGRILNLAKPEPVEFAVEWHKGGEQRTLHLRPISLIDSAGIKKTLEDLEGSRVLDPDIIGSEMEDAVAVFLHQLEDVDKDWLCKQMGCGQDELRGSVLAEISANGPVLAGIIEAVDICHRGSYPEKDEEFEQDLEDKKKAGTQGSLTFWRLVLVFGAGAAAALSLNWILS